MVGSEIEITVRSITGSQVTFDAPPNITYYTLLEAAGEEIEENLLSYLQSPKYCLTLVIPNLEDTPRTTAVRPGAVLQISPVNSIPEKNRLKVKGKTMNPDPRPKGNPLR